MFWRRRIYQKVGGIDPSYRFAMDYDLLIRMLRAGARTKKLRTLLAHFRVHPDSKSGHLQTVSDAEVRRTLEREGLWRDSAAIRFLLEWRYRLLRFSSDPRTIVSAIVRRLRVRHGPQGVSVR
jgi:GT2 family glycosyltransferase